MSEQFLIYAQKTKEYASIGRIAGRSHHALAGNESLGCSFLLFLLRASTDGAIVVSHEDFEFDQLLSVANDVTELIRQEAGVWRAPGSGNTELDRVICRGIRLKDGDVILNFLDGHSLPLRDVCAKPEIIGDVASVVIDNRRKWIALY
jgi:hypothetical protein